MQDFFSDLFDEEVRSAGKVLLVMAAGATYFVQRDQGSRLLTRNDVQYAIEAYLPQGYDRGIIAARAHQRTTKTLLIKSLGIDAVKDQLRVAVDRESKLSGLKELFKLTLVGILSAAHVHSLTITLYVVKMMTLVLVALLRRREEQQGSRGGTVVSKIRSWWSGGTQNLIMQTILEKMEQQMGLDSPLTQMMNNEDDIERKDAERGFSVEALLHLAVPRVVEMARRVVEDALDRRPPHVFSATGIVTGRDLQELLEEISEVFEDQVVWSDWLTPPPVRKSTEENGIDTNNNDNDNHENHNQFDHNGKNGYRSNSRDSGNKGLISPFSDSDDNDSDDDDAIIEYPSGSTAVLTDECSSASQRKRNQRAMESVFGPSRDISSEERAAHEAAYRREELTRDQAAGFFHQLIHSASFNEICIAYAAEIMEQTVHIAGNLRHVRTYDVGTDSAKMPQVISSLDAHRLQMFDRDFVVRPYLRLLCEETVRATCRQS
ncbi:uncharacterized protein TM35_000063870 [Trypanosoma theileri]|uniref:Uncharacterized protein n=1 Tax=Trypanosoma theileri TaxID=67003 RepID=A0A1X0P397_9TRYP|nr:uncharacterized protein TM35_000063870 [Trypanosoma theileri]ORC91382.1 hypothetical protein TM35_000063870 [Trypanosoma theileri]